MLLYHIRPLVLLCVMISCQQWVDKNNVPISQSKPSDTATRDFQDSTNSEVNVLLEQQVIDTIYNLPEVKKRAGLIERLSGGKRHLIVWIAASPNVPDKNYYWVKVGEDNGVSLVSHYNFFVYPDSMRIMYFDTRNEQMKTLETWEPEGVH